MPILGWVCLGLFVLFAMVVIYFFAVLEPAARKEREKTEKRIRKRGRLVQAYILMANDSLYQKNSSTGCSYAQVVYFGEDVKDDDAEALFEEIAPALRAYTSAEKNADKNDHIVASIMKTNIPYTYSLRVPEEVSGDTEAYTISLNVFWNLLPKKRLTKNSIWCYVLEGEEGGALMVDQADYE